MAQRRMFDKSITNNDKFIELPATAQNLYFHLSMNADDDGFIDNWRSITRMIGSNNNDIEELLKNDYIIKFESGVIVVKHWNINNTIRKERHHETKYIDDYKKLFMAENNEYILVNDYCRPSDTQMSPEIRSDKNRLDENRIEQIRIDKKRKEEDREGKKREEIEILYSSDILRKDVIDHLNKKIKSNYDYNDLKTKSLFEKWIDKGYRKIDFEIVIDKKYDEWINTKFAVHLTPTTLFGDKFEMYLNQPVAKKSLKDLSAEEIDEIINLGKEDDTTTIY